MKAAITVLLPVYNGRKYLGEAVESVLAQEHADFELLACDDASSDDSGVVLESYRDPRLRVFRNASNKGLFANLNELASRAQAPLLRLWAQDDRMKPNCLRSELAFWSKHPELGLSYCAYDTINDRGEVVREPDFDATPEVIAPWLAAQIAFYWGCLAGNISTVTIRRSVLERVGPFNTALRASGDFDMWTRISGEHPIGFIRDALVQIRAHDEQLSRSANLSVTFIREDRAVRRELARRIPPELRRHAWWFDTRHRRRLHVQHAFRLVLSGRWQSALAILSESRKDGGLLLPLIAWMASANGRLLPPRPRYLDPSTRASSPRAS